MSGGGGGIIIIKNLIENPGTSADEKAVLNEIFRRMRDTHTCSWSDRRKVKAIVGRLLYQP